MARAPRILSPFFLLLLAVDSMCAQQSQTVQIASLRPSHELVLRRISPNAQQPDGPVLYQLVFTPGTPGTIAKFDTNTRHLVNSDISDSGGIVAIGNSGFTINANTGIVTFVNGQTFPSTGTVTSVSNSDNLLTISSPNTTPVIDLNTTNTDARYVLKAGDTMSGTLNLPANGLVAGGSQLVLSGGKVGIGTNNPNAQLQVTGAGGGSSFGGGVGQPGDTALNATGGPGGEMVGNGSTGGAGGSATIAGGTGGSTFGNGSTGGTGGSTTIAGGAGGPTIGTSSTGGTGGSTTIAGGAGGSAGGFGSPSVGKGGNVFIEPGSGNPSGNVLIADVGGNVGIGTATPGQKLDVAGRISGSIGIMVDSSDSDNGTIAVGGANNANLLLFGAANSGEAIGSQRATNGGGNGNNRFGLDFYTAHLNRMFIDQGGTVHVVGNLTKGGGSFQIDHPLDPANKYLSHSFVESPDMKNVYDGLVVLNAKGVAWVEMPSYFEALNQEFRYQLTPIGAPGPNLYIAREITGHRFKIAGGKPGAKISWQITGIRHDAYANAHRIQVEEDKGEKRGTYLHPELFEKQETVAAGGR